MTWLYNIFLVYVPWPSANYPIESLYAFALQLNVEPLIIYEGHVDFRNSALCRRGYNVIHLFLWQGSRKEVAANSRREDWINK